MSPFSETIRHMFGARHLCVAALFVLTACGTPLREEAALEGKSLILAAVEVNADYTNNFFNTTPGTIYDLSLRIWGHANTVGEVDQTFWPQSFTTQSRWIAFSVNPGTYALGEVIEVGNGGTLTFKQSQKTTKFDGAYELPLFEVGPNEALYIGTFRAQLGTNYGDTFGQFGGRLLRDARKTYALQANLARLIASPFTRKGGTFRAIDVFSNSPGALAKYSVLWASRLNDAEFDPEPVDEVEDGKKANGKRDSRTE